MLGVELHPHRAKRRDRPRREIEADAPERGLGIGRIRRQVALDVPRDRLLHLSHGLSGSCGQPCRLGLARGDPGELAHRREVQLPLGQRAVELRQLAQLARHAQPLVAGVRAVAERQLEVRRERRLAICPPDLELVRHEQELGLARVERAAFVRDLREAGVHGPAVGEMVLFENRHDPLYTIGYFTR